jgi:threonine synthase
VTRDSQTPLERNDALGLWLKRDDQARFGTHKSRGLGSQIKGALGAGATGFVISSSGNAALAAASWCVELAVPCLSFLSDKTATAQIEAVAAVGGPTIVTPKPKNLSRYAARYAGLTDLRPSRDANGAMGYRSLAPELVHQLDAVPTAVFCFVNSALTLIGMSEAFEKLKQQGRIETLPQLHAVQCSRETDLAARLGAEQRAEDEPAAGALGARTPPDLDRTIDAVRGSGGSVWMVRNSEVAAAAERLTGLGLSVAAESAAAVAGALLARDRWELGERPVVIIAAPRRTTDTSRADVLDGVFQVNDYEGVRDLLAQLKL